MPLRADVLVTDHPAPRDALRPGTPRPCSRPEAIDVPVGLFFAAHRYIHRSGAAQPRRGYVLERARERRPILGRRRLSRQTRVTKRAPFLPGQAVQPASARLPRLVARGYTGLAVTGLLSVSSFYDGSAGL